MNKVIVILGPTASGKTNLAIKLALELGGEIISADSRQIYKYLDIGTGKVKEEEKKGIIHHGIDIVDPKKNFSVIQYQKYALKKIKEIIKKGKVPIICGGTGFYIDAITRNFILPEVKPNLKLRKELSKNTPEKNFEILKSLDSDRAKNIDSKNNVRLIRAIEIAKALGKVPRILDQKSKYKFLKIGLKVEKEKLEKNINKRVKQMFKEGLEQEVENLKKMGIKESRLKDFGFEYHNPTLESVISESKKYAKRQMTYFKRDKDINWIEVKNYKEIKALISSFLL